MKKMRVKICVVVRGPVDQVAQACSGTVRLEQCKCGPAGERGGGTFVLRHGAGQLGWV